MKRWFAVALPGLFLTGLLAAAEPRWMSIGPPAVPPYARLFPDSVDGSRQYALSAAGLWSTRNGGGSWRLLQNGLEWPPQAFAADPAHPGRLYVSVVRFDGETTIRRSDDFGDHWRVVYSTPYSSPSYPQDLQVDPRQPDTLYWLEQQFLHRSRDGGKTWSCYPETNECVGVVLTVNSFALAPDRPGTVYISGGGWGFYVTHDGGQTWTHSTLLEVEHPPDVLVATREPRTLYAWSRDSFYRGNLDPCFVRSDDEGATWKVFLRNTKCGMPAIDPDDPRTVRIVVVVDGAPQLWISRDAGDHWSTAGDVPWPGDLTVFPGGRLALATDLHGIFEAAGDGGPWRPANRGFSASEITAVLPTEHGLLAAPIEQGYTPTPPMIPLRGTRDGGRTWTDLPLINPSALAADPVDSRHLIAAARRYDPLSGAHPRVLESLDEGATWRGVVDPQTDPDQFRTLAIDPFDPHVFYSGSNFRGFFRSLDGGRTWQESNAGLRLGGCHHYYCDPNRVFAIFPDPKRQGRLVIHFERQVYESLDGGSTWTLRGPSLPRSGRVMLLALDLQGNLVAVGTGTKPNDARSLGVVYRSADGGRTWSREGRLPVYPDSGFGTEITGMATTPAGLFVSAVPFGVFRSQDGGRTWELMNAGLPSTRVTSLTADPFDPSLLYATVPLNGVYAIRVP